MEPITTWTKPPETIALANKELHVWQMTLDHPPVPIEVLSTWLSADEVARAERFTFPRDHNDFIVGRGMLRALLGRYLGVSPSNISIQKGVREKPYVAIGSGESPLHFNVSHSHGLAMYAFALHGQVGIDVEKLRPEFATEKIATQFFSTSEQNDLLRLSQESRVQGFFNCWTRKEAYVKATGQGLHIPLGSFDVSLIPGNLPALRAPDSEKWSLFAFSPAKDYAAAIVVEGQPWDLRFYDGNCFL